MRYDLPRSVTLGGKAYPIRADFRVALDIFEILNDRELEETERIFLTLTFFYPELDAIPQELWQEALEACFRFLSGGREETQQGPMLMNWEQDFPWIIAPVNRVVGQEVRSLEFFHWWSFLGAYMEIGECTFAQIVRIRAAKSAGRRLDKADEEWYRKNRSLVELPQKLTQSEENLLKTWGGSGWNSES